MVIAAGAVVWVQSDGTIAVAPTDADLIAGVSCQPGSSGDPVNVMTFGVLDVYTALTIGAKYWMDQLTGQPTVTMPTSGLIVRMGVAVSPTALSLRLTVVAPSIEFLDNDDLTGQSTTQSLATITTTDLGTYRVSGYIAVTTIGSATMTFTVGFVDENGNSRSLNLIPATASTATISANGFYTFHPIDIRVGAGQVITVQAVKASGSGLAYDAGGGIQGL